MERLLDINSLREHTRRFTNDDLLAMRKNLDVAVSDRLNRRQHMSDRNISRAMIRYLKREIEEAGYTEILGQDISMYYCPEFEGQNYKDTSSPSMHYPERMGISFRYGDILVAKRYVDDEETTEFDNIYRVNIELKYGHRIRIILEAPVHHVRPPPYEKFVFGGGRDSAKIQWKLGFTNVPKDKICNIPGCIIKSQLTSAAKRRAIYGKELLDAFVDFYITRNTARLTLSECCSINKKYKEHFIAGAWSATMCFLMIGRFHPKSLTGLSEENQALWRMNIPVDVIRYIAKMIWESRYDNNVWGTKVDVRSQKVDWSLRNATSLWYDEDHYVGYPAPHGWTPWFEKKKY